MCKRRHGEGMMLDMTHRWKDVITGGKINAEYDMCKMQRANVEKGEKEWKEVEQKEVG
jgi:hypothetical protein